LGRHLSGLYRRNEPREKMVMKKFPCRTAGEWPGGCAILFDGRLVINTVMLPLELQHQRLAPLPPFACKGV
jgi:hypothetical protein